MLVSSYPIKTEVSACYSQYARFIPAIHYYPSCYPVWDSIPTMDLRAPCNFCTSIRRSSILSRLPPSPYSSSSLSCRRKMTAELQTAVGVNGRTDSYSPSIPTHKVTVHDRQRGEVHEFFVSEVFAHLTVSRCLVIILSTLLTC